MLIIFILSLFNTNLPSCKFIFAFNNPNRFSKFIYHLYKSIIMNLQTSSTHRSMRSSLYPFIRNPPDEKDAESNYIQAQDSSKRQQFKFLERYHDESFIVKEKKSTRVQKYARVLNSITRVFKYVGREKLSAKGLVKDRRDQNLTFNPQSLGLYIWNLIIAISILYHFFQIPICLFFTVKAFEAEFQVLFYRYMKSSFGLACNIISLIVLFINIVYVIPNTQYYHNGFLVSNQSKIIQRYLGWRLMMDVLGYVAAFVFVVGCTYELVYLKVVFYLMVNRLSQVDDMLQRRVELTKIRLAGYKLCRIILLLLFLVVWLAAIFFAIDYYYYQQGTNATYSGNQLWLVDSQATNSMDIIQFYNDWSVWFNYSVYWCIQTVSMVGFGDITGKNPVEVMYTSLIITLVVVSYAFFITGVWEIIAQAREFKQYQNKQWRVYKEYQKENMRPLDRKKQSSQKGIRYRELKNKVGSYLSEMWSNEKSSSEINILEVLDKSLTPQLKDQVFINYRQHLFRRVQLFSRLQKLQAKNYKYIFSELIFKITQMKYAKDQVIINAGDLSLNLVYLVNGRLKIEYPHSNYCHTFRHSLSSDIKQPGNTYKDKNSNFAVKQFFTQQRMSYSVKSESFCKTSELSMDSFLKSIRSVEQFYMKYCQLRDKLKLYNEDVLTGERCIECGSNEHDLDRCEESDIAMFYKQLWMKIGTRAKSDKTQSKGKCPKITFRRRNTKSLKIINQTSRRGKQINIEKLHNFTTYYPSHNLSMV